MQPVSINYKQTYVHTTREKWETKSRKLLFVAKISECFFLHYNMTNNRITPEENEECNNCIVSSKPLVFTFKSAKNVISCTISIEKERLTLTVKKAKGMETINSVHILDYEELEKFELNTTDNSTIVTHCSLFTQMLKNIPKKLNDLSVAMFQDRIELSNHIVHPDKDVQTVSLFILFNFQKTRYICF